MNHSQEEKPTDRAPRAEELTRVTLPAGYDELLDRLDPLLAQWYRQQFPALSPPQALAVPEILAGHNILVSSPTGTGKTLTGFLAVLDYLFKQARQGKLEDRVYCVYVSPLKALANDIDHNLRTPLAEMGKLARQLGETPFKIRVGVRSGDTPASKRAAMTRKPPHILITTPESLSLVLAAPKFSGHLRGVTHLIVDELHDLATSKRGTMLTLAQEQLCHELEAPPVRIGLSATLAPLELLAHFLCGYEAGKPRPCSIVEIAQWKQLDLKVVCPVSDGTRTPASLAWEKQMELLVKLIHEHTTTLIFTNTRASTERVLLELKELGVEAVAAHHGSMSKEVRLKVERQLKGQKLQAVVSSTSLELGLDIGSLDLVVQLGSPRSVAKGLQRVGRAGHALQAVAKGRFIAYEPDDLLECTALVQEAMDGSLDRIRPIEGALDVLAQALVGLSLHREWSLDELFQLVRRAWPYRDLTEGELNEIVDYLSTMELAEEGVYPRVRYDEHTRTLGPRKGSRLLYYLNLGTIPSHSTYTVVLETTGQPLGSLEESFVEHLRRGDIFVLGGRLYANQGLRGSALLVRDGQSRRPTVPSWGGEVAPRSRELSAALSRLRSRLERDLRLHLPDKTDGRGTASGEAELQARWQSELRLNEGAATTLFNHLQAQLKLVKCIPTQQCLLVEGYLDPQDRPGLIIHSPWGRQVNEAWGRAMVRKLEQGQPPGRRGPLRLTVAEEGFMLDLPLRYDPEELVRSIGAGELRSLLCQSMEQSEPLQLRFRNCAGRALAVLRNYRVQEVSLRRQRQRAKALLERLVGSDHLLMREALRELHDGLWDVTGAERLLQELEAGDIELVITPYDAQVSPMGLPILLAGLAGNTTLQERWNLQKELHAQILARLIPEHELGKPRFEEQLLKTFFDQRRRLPSDEQGLIELFRWFGALDLIGEGPGSLAQMVLDDHLPEGLEEPTDRKLVEKEAIVSKGPLENECATGSGHVEGQEVTDERVEDERDKGAVEKAEEVEKIKDAISEPGEKWPWQGAFEALFAKGRVVPVWTGDEGPRWALAEQAAGYHSLYGQPGPLSRELREARRRLAQGRTLRGRHLVRGLRRAGQAGHDPGGKLVVCQRPVLMERERALEAAIEGQLRSRGPSTVAELAERLRLEVEELTATLEGLLRKGLVSLGNFREGGGMNQYLMTEDCIHLELLGEGESRVAQESSWLAMVFQRSLEPRADLFQTLAAMLGAAHTQPVWQRWPELTLSGWQELLNSGELLQGRFKAGSTLTVPAPLVPLFVSAFGMVGSREGLEAKLLKLLKAAPEGLTRQEMNTVLTEVATTESVTEALHRLEGSLRVHRRPVTGYGPRPLQRYLSLPETPPVERPLEELVLRLLEGQGPATRDQLVNLSGLEGRALSVTLGALESRGLITRLACSGQQPRYLFLLQEDVPELLQPSREPPAPLLLHRQDPLVQRQRRQLQVHFGEGWNLVFFLKGKAVGALDLELSPGVVEVTGCQLDDPDDLPILLDELDRLRGYYRQVAGDSLVWRRGAGGPLGSRESELLHHFEAAGYTARWDLLVRGTLVESSFPFEKLLAFMLVAGHIHPAYRYSSAREAIADMRELRDLFELSLRVKGPFQPPSEYAPAMELVLAPGSFGSRAYMTVARAQLLQAVLDQRPNAQMARVLELLPGEQPLPKEGLVRRSSLERRALNRALRALSAGLLVVKDPWGDYRRLERDPDLTPEEARRRLVLETIRELGLVSFQGLIRMLGRWCNSERLYQALTKLEHQGLIEKGFLDQDEVTLLYLAAGTDQRIDGVPPFQGAFVIAPSDRLAKLLAPRTKQEFGLVGAHIICEGSSLTGAFKLKRKGRRVQVVAFVGEEPQRFITEEWARQFKMDLRWDLTS